MKNGVRGQQACDVWCMVSPGKDTVGWWCTRSTVVLWCKGSAVRVQFICSVLPQFHAPHIPGPPQTHVPSLSCLEIPW